MSKKNKINWLLILQGMTMLLVVIGHAGVWDTQEEMPRNIYLIYKTIYSFHMSLFIFISGYLFYLTRLSPMASQKWGGYVDIMKDKLIRLGIPFLVFTIIGMVVKHYFASNVVRPTELSMGELVHAILYPAEGPLAEMYFIAVILTMFAISPVLKWSLTKVYYWVPMLAVLIVIKHIGPQEEFLNIRSTAFYALYFYIGLLVAKYDLIEKLRNKVCDNSLVYLVAILGVAIYILGLYTSSILLPYGGWIVSLGISLVLDKHIPSAFSSFRNYTYQIFLMGLFFQEGVKYLYRLTDVHYMVACVISVLVGLYMPVIISRLLEKLNFKPLLLCVGLK